MRVYTGADKRGTIRVTLVESDCPRGFNSMTREERLQFVADRLAGRVRAADAAPQDITADDMAALREIRELLDDWSDRRRARAQDAEPSGLEHMEGAVAESCGFNYRRRMRATDSQEPEPGPYEQIQTAYDAIRKGGK